VSKAIVFQLTCPPAHLPTYPPTHYCTTTAHLPLYILLDLPSPHAPPPRPPYLEHKPGLLGDGDLATWDKGTDSTYDDEQVPTHSFYYHNFA
jgi:hypothetical protein